MAGVGFVHPWAGLKCLAAPGVEHSDGEDQFVLRLGIAYSFEFDRWIVGPAFDVNFMEDGESYVYGLNFGWSF